MRPARSLARQPSLPVLVLILASYAFRLPALLNAKSTNSDAAIVGLQAIHILKGEVSPFLWGSGYQTSADAFVAALFFRALGSTPLALMLSSLTLHVILTALVFAVVRRLLLSSWLGLIAVLPLIASPSSVHSYALYPPRQLSLTLAIAAFWAIFRAAEERAHLWPRAWLAAGGALATLAVSADPYPLVLLPLVGLFALIIAWPRIRDVASFAGGALVGILPFAAIHALPRALNGPMGFTFKPTEIARHFRLLYEECLPWALGYKVYYARHVMDYAPWDAPAWFRIVGVGGAFILLGLVAYALIVPITMRPLAPSLTMKLGFVGALAFPVTLAAFLLSVMVMDHFSMRYLVALSLMTPFAVVPAARALGGRRFALLFSPHVLACAIGGWVGYGPFVRGILPVVEVPELRDDYALKEVLHARGVRWATADYWTSYRLTFLHREELIVVPTNTVEDRYPPYRQTFEAQPQFAYIFDPARSREDEQAFKDHLVAQGELIESFDVGRLHVCLVKRRLN